MFLIKFIFRFIKYLILALFYLWTIGAVYYLSFMPDSLRTAVMWIFIVLIPLILIVFRKKNYGYLLVLFICLVIAAYYKFQTASNIGDWQTSWAVMPTATISGDEVSIKNIRDFQYRTENDFTPHYYDKTYNLNDLESLYVIFSYWDGNKSIAHTILSFGFKGPSYLCVSVETRLKKGQVQGGIEGLYNQYGLIYILADENDVLKLRTNYRREDVYMYQLKIKNKELLRAFFLSVIEKANSLNDKPQFYNTLEDNCFTSLLSNLRRTTGERMPFDYKYICNGYADKLLYDRGNFVTEGETSFAEFKKKHYINQYIKADTDSENYSSEIRQFEKK